MNRVDLTPRDLYDFQQTSMQTEKIGGLMKECACVLDNLLLRDDDPPCGGIETPVEPDARFLITMAGR